MRAKAIYACVAENPGEVTFDADDCLTAVSDSPEDGWLVGTVETTAHRGLFPVVYTELVPETGDDIRFLQKLQRSGLLSSTMNLNQFARSVPPPPPMSAKPLLARPSARPPLAPKPATKPKPAHLTQQNRPSPPALLPKPLHLTHPMRPPKPPGNIDLDPEVRRQKEREAAEQWEARFAIGAAKPIVSVNPPQQPSTDPSTENDPPTLPFNSVRSARALESLVPSQREVSNPALENVPPPLPYSSSRRVGNEPVVAPVECAIQPNPRQLIAQLNGNSSSRAASTRAFEDNFDPLAHNNVKVPLTLARQVKSSSTISSLAQPQQPELPPKPTMHRQLSSASRSVSFAGHAPATSSTTPTMLSPALSFNNNGGSGFLQSPLTTAIHRSAKKPDAIPEDALARYVHLFKRLDKQHGKRGVLNADEVHAVVVRCRLPDDLLRRIWALADRNLNGKFGPAEFYIIMHLTDCALRQEPIPEQLSVDLLRSAYQS